MGLTMGVKGKIFKLGLKSIELLGNGQNGDRVVLVAGGKDFQRCFSLFEFKLLA